MARRVCRAELLEVGGVSYISRMVWVQRPLKALAGTRSTWLFSWTSLSSTRTESRPNVPAQGAAQGRHHALHFPSM